MSPYIITAIFFFLLACFFFTLFLHRYFALTNFFAHAVIVIGTVAKSRNITPQTGVEQIALVKVRTQEGKTQKVMSEPFYPQYGGRLVPGTVVKVQVGQMQEFGRVRNMLYVIDPKYTEEQATDIQWYYLVVGTAFLLATIVLVLSSVIV